MDAFDRARERKRIINLASTGFSRGKTQNRPQPLAAGKQTVAHRAVKRSRFPVRFRQIAVKRAVDQLLASGEVDFETHFTKMAGGIFILDNAIPRRVSSSIRINRRCRDRGLIFFALACLPLWRE